MPKIITPPIEWKIPCLNCLAVISYTIPDIYSHRDGWGDTKFYIICPACSNKIYVPKSKESRDRV